MSRAQYTYSSQPRTLTHQSHDELAKTQKRVIVNIMNDPRVKRGHAYKQHNTTLENNNIIISRQHNDNSTSNTRSVLQNTINTIPHWNQHLTAVYIKPDTSAESQQQSNQLNNTTQLHSHYNSTQPLYRVSTPEPVSGRVHSDVQTDQYIEDLRLSTVRANKIDTANQSDELHDYDTAVLFVPRSSGIDMGTQITPDELQNELFDFDLAIQPILSVLTQKILNESLVDVCEEIELSQIQLQYDIYERQRQLKASEVQRLQAIDDGRTNQRLALIQQAVDRQYAAQQQQINNSITLAVQDTLNDITNNVIQQLKDENYFSDRFIDYLNNVCMNQLVDRVYQQLQQQAVVHQLIDSMLQCALTNQQSSIQSIHEQRRINDTDNTIQSLVNGQTKPILSILSQSERHNDRIDHTRYKLCEFKHNEHIDDYETHTSNEWIQNRLYNNNEITQYIHNIILIQCQQRTRVARKRVHKLLIAHRLKQARLEMTPDNLIQSLKPSLQFTADEQLNVIECDLFTAAAHAGLCINDTVISMNNTSIASVEQMQQIIDTLICGEMCAIEIKRHTTDIVESIRCEVASSEIEYDINTIRELREQANLPVNDMPLFTSESAHEFIQNTTYKFGCTFMEYIGSIGSKLTKVVANGIAGKSGLHNNDVLIQINEYDIKSGSSASNRIKQYRTGDTITLTLLTQDAINQIAELDRQSKADNVKPVYDRSSYATRSITIEIPHDKYTLQQVRNIKLMAAQYDASRTVETE